MIPKGNQRSGGQQLATHLLNSYDNDRVEVAEVRGAIAQDLHGAFAEWYAEAKVTNCVKYLYSLSINPDHRQGPYTREHYYDFISRTEKSLGLAEQPRAVVFHVKHGRAHCHVVWSRIDSEKGKAVQLSHDRQKLRAVAQQYARDHNLTLPPGMRNNRGKDRFPDHAKTENLGEKQQEERTGTSKIQRMEEITRAWRESDDAPSFVKALEDKGYTFARGDKRSYVVVDLYGEIHSLSRQLDGVKSKELKARLAGYDLDKLPTAVAAQDRAREKRQELLLQKQREEHERNPPSTAEPAAPTKLTANERREALQKAQGLRRADLEIKRQQLGERHAAERKALSEMQSARSEDVARDRAARQPKGLMALLGRITGFNAIAAFRQSWQDRKREQEYGLQNASLARRHGREMENFKHREHGLTSLDKRERRSLETAIRRDVFRSIAAPAKTLTIAVGLTPARRAQAQRATQMAEAFRAASSGRQRALGPTPEQREKIEAFKQGAADISAPAKAEPCAPEAIHPEVAGGEQKQTQSEPPGAEAGVQKKSPEHISAKFKETAAPSPLPPPQGLSEEFNEEAGTPAPAKTEATKEQQSAPPARATPAAESAGDPRLRDLKENEKDLTAEQRKAIDLAKEFRERAGQGRPLKDRDKDKGGRDRNFRQTPADYSVRR